MLISTTIPCFPHRTQRAEANVPSLVTPNVIYGGNLTMRQVWFFSLPVSVHRCSTHFQPPDADVTNTSQLIALLNKSIFFFIADDNVLSEMAVLLRETWTVRWSSGSLFFIPVRPTGICGKQNTTLLINIFLCIGWIVRLKTSVNRRQFLCLF